MRLFELECRDCGETILLELDKQPDVCPYCTEPSIDYAPGTIEPVLEYVPRKERHAEIKGLREQISSVENIRTQTAEGKLLIAAIGQLMATPVYMYSTPEEVLAVLNTISERFKGGGNTGPEAASTKK